MEHLYDNKGDQPQFLLRSSESPPVEAQHEGTRNVMGEVYVYYIAPPL